MAKAVQDPKEIFQEIINDYKGLFGDDLVSIILYGSATGKDYRPGKSDINFMIVLSEEGINNIDKAFKTVSKWQKRKVAIPLFLTRAYVETSTDVFPVEYLNFRRNHVLVHGDDIIKDLSFNNHFIRLQAEREIKGKLILLREAFLESAGKGWILKTFINQSLQAFVAVFEALLFLKGSDIPEDKRSVIDATCDIFNIDKDLFNKLLDIRENKIKVNDRELTGIFKEYIIEIRKLVKIVDELGG
jgi:hypothetical protein